MSATGKRELPVSWQWSTLGEITAPSVDQGGPQGGRDFVYVDIGSVDGQKKRIVEPRVIAVADAPSRARQRLVVDDVLVSMTRPNLNAVARVPAELDGAIGSTGFQVLRGIAVDPRWIAYAVQTTEFVESMTALVQGALYPAVRPRDIRSYRIPVPPLAEQRRIVAALEEHLSDLDAALAGIERARERLIAYLSACFEAAVNGRLMTTVGRFCPAKNYDWRPLRETIANISQGWSPKCDPAPPANDLDWGVIKTTAVQTARYNTAESKSLPSEFSPRPDLEIRVGDLLVTRKGPRARAGVAAAVRSTRPRLMLCDTVYRIRLKAEMARPHYMAIAMSSPTVAAAINAAKAGISESGVSLTHDRLGAILVPLPSLDEQAAIETEIDRRMEAVERLRTEIDCQVARAARLRHSILKRAYEGKLIPQDPSDETASALLARLGGTSHVSGATAPRARGGRTRSTARRGRA